MTEARQIRIGNLTMANSLPFVLIAGPCAMESRDHAFEIAAALKEITERLGVGLIYKTSFDKANRTSLKAQRGVGLSHGLDILAEVRERIGCPVLTDVHEDTPIDEVAEVVDVLQTPAFLARQTDFIQRVARAHKPMNVKKGQFQAPWDMKHVVQKCRDVGNEQVTVCERGVSFGYNTLVSDMRALPIMAEIGCPIVFDATHSVQQPGGQGGRSGGQREFVPHLARAAVSIGVAAVFMETHPDPDNAPSDGPNMIPVDQMRALIDRLVAFDRLSKGL